MLRSIILSPLMKPVTCGVMAFELSSLCRRLSFKLIPVEKPVIYQSFRRFSRVPKGHRLAAKRTKILESLKKDLNENVGRGPLIQPQNIAIAEEPLPTIAELKQQASLAKLRKRIKRGFGGQQSVMNLYGYDYGDDTNTFPIYAYALCDEFNLERLLKGLITQGLYTPTVFSEDLPDVIHVHAKYPIGDESREIFFFRDGVVVFWNVPQLERINVFRFLREFEEESYEASAIEDESECLWYTYGDQGPSRLSRGKVILGMDIQNKILEKYAFANALASSCKLGIWESMLEKYVEGIEQITETLKRAEAIKLSREQVLQKTGELFSLRHQLNLNSDLLETPDFYWERERLENLYQKTCDYLIIQRRTKVMNEKLSQCCELLDLISTHLTDQHHTRLEWMIIILIMIEVGFEILHLLERYELVHI